MRIELKKLQIVCNQRSNETKIIFGRIGAEKSFRFEQFNKENGHERILKELAEFIAVLVTNKNEYATIITRRQTEKSERELFERNAWLIMRWMKQKQTFSRYRNSSSRPIQIESI